MVVHPAAGNHDGTLVNALLHHLTDLSGIGGELRPGIVHRIDKDTSGLLLVAKNDFSHVALSEQIKAHTVERAYLAIVQGNLKEESGSVDGPIGRHPYRPQAHGHRAGRAKRPHRLEGFEAAARLDIDRSEADDRAYPPDPRSHGLHRTSGGGRPGVRPQEAAH